MVRLDGVTQQHCAKRARVFCVDGMSAVLWRGGFRGKEFVYVWGIVLKEERTCGVVLRTGRFGGLDVLYAR